MKFNLGWRCGEQILSLAGSVMVTVGLVSVLTGLVFLMQSHREFRRFGAAPEAVSVGFKVITKEVGPVIAGLIFAGTCGAGICAELGKMSADRELTALRLLGLSQVRLLLLPRLIASAVVGFLSTGLFFAFSTLASFLCSVYFLRLVTATRYETLVDLGDPDVGRGLFKGAVFGLASGLASYVTGASVDPRAEEGPGPGAAFRFPTVRDAALYAFGASAVLILAFDFLIGAAL